MMGFLKNNIHAVKWLALLRKSQRSVRSKEDNYIGVKYLGTYVIS